MTLELADRLVFKPIGIAKDVLVKTGRALIDVHKGELTLRIRNEAITYNLDQTSRYSSNYNQMTAKKIDVIDMACEEYSQEVLGFSDVTASGNPTPYDDSTVSTTSPTLNPFGDSDFLLFEEADAFLGLEDVSNSPEFNPFYYDLEGDILLLEAILNRMDECLALADLGASINLMPLSVWEGLSLPKLTPTYMTLKLTDRSVSKPIGIAKDVSVKVGVFHFPADFVVVDFEPDPRVPLILGRLSLRTYLPISNTQEGDNKLPDIISKELGDEEKSALIKVLKSHKRAIAWKLSDIQGINPEFCTHKILMEEDYKPTVQHQRRVNLKIHDIIKKEMLERLAGNKYYCFLDGFFGYLQIPNDPRDQEKTTFTCPYGMFAYRRMPFGLYNESGTFQRCMLAIFHDMVEKTMEV
nr:reverse transcriptase domain-containing protein [Tanacetum cinerariifolium]